MDAEGRDRVVGGRYRLLDLVGRGAVGVVWTAQDQLLDRMVAVKEVTPPPHLGQAERSTVQQRTLREARLAARLTSVAAVTVYDVVAEGETSWIVMEWFPAPSLGDVLRDSGPLSVTEAASVGLALVDALQVAHTAGVLHRDVKPANVMLTDRGAVLTDFGIAHRDGDPGLTATGMVLGSPSFIAPERARGEPGGPPTDLWSLGATLYAAVEGRGPFDRDGQLATLHAVIHDEPPAPRRAGPLGPVLLRLLAKESSARPTADQARALLEQARRDDRGDVASLVSPTVSMSADQEVAPTTPPATWSTRTTRTTRAGDPGLPLDRPPRRRRRLVVPAALALAGVGALLVGAVVLLPALGSDTGDETTGAPTATPPVPFDSAALYAFSRYLFDPDECAVPEPGAFPVSEIEPDTELVKCADPPYTGTFWCKADAEGLAADRQVYLSRAVEGSQQEVSSPPAGQEEPVDGIQVAFNHVSGNDGRVYWDSPDALCAGELQAGFDDLDATVDHWLAGQGS